MSNVAGPGYWLLGIELTLLLNCQPFEDSWLSALLALSYYAPIIITVCVFVFGVRQRELYIVLFGFGLLIDDSVSRAANALLPGNASGRVAPNCLPVYGDAIAYQVQQATYFVTFGLGYAILYRTRANMTHVGTAIVAHTAVVVGAHYLNMATREAILAGAALGAFDALVFQSLLHWLAVPRFGWFINFAPAWLDYRDTLCSAKPCRRKKDSVSS